MRDENQDSSDEGSTHDRRKSNFLLPTALLRRRSSSTISLKSSNRRRRGLSRGSISSRSIATHGSHDAQISDNEGSDDSIGETDEDVCFPADETQGIDLGQLDQLLDDDVETPSLDKLENTQIKSPADLKLSFLPTVEPPPCRLPDPATPVKPSSASAVSSISTNERHRFSFFASNQQETIHATELASLVNEGESFSTLFTPNNGTWWLDCEDCTDQELKILSKAFGIHPLTTDDIRTEESREKFELFSRYYFVCFHTFGNNPQNKDYYLEPINFYVLVFDDGVVSFHTTPISHCRNVRRRMRQLRDYVVCSSDWICYALIDDITDSFAPLMHEVEVETDHIEDSVYTGSSDMSGTLGTIAETRKTTMSLMRLLSGKADVIKGYSKRCGEMWSGRDTSDVVLYLSDIQDHIITMSQNLNAYEKMLSRAHSNYMSYLQMEFVNASNRMTSVLSKATLLGTVLVPMSLITGIFGMNVKVPGQDVENDRWFFGILGVMILTVIVLTVGSNWWLQRKTQENESSCSN